MTNFTIVLVILFCSLYLLGIIFLDMSNSPKRTKKQKNNCANLALLNLFLSGVPLAIIYYFEVII